MKDTSRVGVLGIERYIEVTGPMGSNVLMPRMDIFLSLPSSERVEAHSLEKSINDAIDSCTRGGVEAVEELCAGIVRELLTAYPRATGSEVRLEADYVVMKRAPVSGQKTQELYKILSRAVSENGRVRKMVGAEVTGMSFCPCAREGLMERSREIMKGTLATDVVDRLLQQIPIASHTQRNISRLLIEVQSKYAVDVNELIRILESSMSSRTYEVLKREDEVEVVMSGHQNPMFVEDVVRKILLNVIGKFRTLPDDSLIIVESESLESIHQHNAVAKRIATLGELRRDLSGL
jgi:GTP cyclohydrolase-4